MFYYRNLSAEEVSSPGGDKGWYASKGSFEVGNNDSPLEAVYNLAIAVKQL